ncbi:hypothetical protein XENORESO_010633, partial [Xenotaenia resolanae]
VRTMQLHLCHFLLSPLSAFCVHCSYSLRKLPSERISWPHTNISALQLEMGTSVTQGPVFYLIQTYPPGVAVPSSCSKLRIRVVDLPRNQTARVCTQMRKRSSLTKQGLLTITELTESLDGPNTVLPAKCIKSNAHQKGKMHMKIHTPSYGTTVTSCIWLPADALIKLSKTWVRSSVLPLQHNASNACSRFQYTDQMPRGEPDVLSSHSSIDQYMNASGDPAVSSTVNPLNTKRTKVKTEAEGPVSISPSSQDHGGGILDLSEDLDKDECKQEPEAVYETNCHWEGCTKEYETQDQLVHSSASAYYNSSSVFF